MESYFDFSDFDALTGEVINEIRRHKRINNSYTKVGYGPWSGMLEGKDARALTKVQIAVWQEFGNSRIPERPFMRQTFDENIDLIEEVSAKLHARYLDGDLTEKQALAMLGEWYTGMIKEQILKGNFTPLAASTIKKKGSTKPLIDTGLNLLGGVDHIEVL